MNEPLTTDNRGRIYCTLTYFEEHYGRNYQTVKQWITTSQVRSITVGQTVYVHLGDARKLDRVTPRQQRRRLQKCIG